MNPNYRGVAFLISLGSLPIACNDKDPADTPGTTDTGNTPPGTDPSGTTTSVDPTTGPDGTSTSTSSSSTGPEPGDTTESPVTTFITTESPTTDDTDDTGPPVFPPPTNPECQAYADHVVECYPRYADYANMIGYYCDGYIMYGAADGVTCTDAIKALFVCFSTVPCDSMDPEAECMAELTAIDAACPSFGGGETSDTGDTGDTGSSG